MISDFDILTMSGLHVSQYSKRISFMERVGLGPFVNGENNDEKAILALLDDEKQQYEWSEEGYEARKRDSKRVYKNPLYLPTVEKVEKRGPVRNMISSSDTVTKNNSGQDTIFQITEDGTIAKVKKEVSDEARDWLDVINKSEM